MVKRNGEANGAASGTAPKPALARKAAKNGAAARTLGPVSDLERHLPTEWWRTLFNSLYLETDGDVVENDRNTEQEIDLLVKSVGLEPNDRILDLCCGQGRHVLELARRGFNNATPLDRPRHLVRLGGKRARPHRRRSPVPEGGARKSRPPGSRHPLVAS